MGGSQAKSDQVNKQIQRQQLDRGFRTESLINEPILRSTIIKNKQSKNYDQQTLTKESASKTISASFNDVESIIQQEDQNPDPVYEVGVFSHHDPLWTYKMKNQQKSFQDTPVSPDCNIYFQGYGINFSKKIADSPFEDYLYSILKNKKKGPKEEGKLFQMMKYTQKELDTPLSDINRPDFQEKAKQIFISLQKFSGDKKLKKEDLSEYLNEVIVMFLRLYICYDNQKYLIKISTKDLIKLTDIEQLQDEALLQVCKQLTENNNCSIKLRYFTSIAILSQYIQPSEKLKFPLLNFFYEIAQRSTKKQQDIGQDQQEIQKLLKQEREWAKYIFVRILEGQFQQERRKELMTEMEFTLNECKYQKIIKIKYSDKRELSLPVFINADIYVNINLESYFTINRFQEQIYQKLKISEKEQEQYQLVHILYFACNDFNFEIIQERPFAGVQNKQLEKQIDLKSSAIGQIQEFKTLENIDTEYAYILDVLYQIENLKLQLPKKIKVNPHVKISRLYLRNKIIDEEILFGITEEHFQIGKLSELQQAFLYSQCCTDFLIGKFTLKDGNLNWSLIKIVKIAALKVLIDLQNQKEEFEINIENYLPLNIIPAKMHKSWSAEIAKELNKIREAENFNQDRNVLKKEFILEILKK